MSRNNPQVLVYITEILENFDEMISNAESLTVKSILGYPRQIAVIGLYQLALTRSFNERDRMVLVTPHFIR